MSKILAQFDGYTLRLPCQADRDLLTRWIESDPAHADRITPEFFMGMFDDGRPDYRPSCMILEDGGGVLFFIRIDRAARVNIQFRPGDDEKTRERNRTGLSKGMAFLEAGLARAGTTEWVFETESFKLAAFARRVLGFQVSPDELVRPIPALRTPEQDGKTLRLVQTEATRAD